MTSSSNSKGSQSVGTVLFIEQFGIAGLAHYAHSLCQALSDIGIDITLLTSKDYELLNLPHSFRLLNRLPLWNPFAPGKKQRRGVIRRLIQAKKSLLYLWSLCICLAKIWKERPAIVHTSEMKYLVDLLLFFVPRRSCLIHTCHNVQKFSEADKTGEIVHTDRLWHHAQSWMYRRCDGVIFHAQENVDEFRQVFGFEPAHWAVIPHGEYDLFAPEQKPSMVQARQTLGLDNKGQLILFFGTLRRYKGADVLLEAMAHLRCRLPDVQLLVAGTATYDLSFQDLQAQARHLSIEEDVIWHPGYVPLERAHLYFYACNVIALPHRKVYDSGILKIAQALGRPVVVTDSGGLASAVEGGQAGIVVPPDNPKALAKALETLIQNPDLAQSLAERGQILAHTAFSWANVADRTEQFYHEVLATSCAC